MMERAAKAMRVLRREGPGSLTRRAVRYAYHRLGAAELEESLRADEIADSTTLRLEVPPVRPARGEPLTVGWLTVPPAAGSGGHTTLFRMVEAVERAGHRCVLFLHDRYDGEPLAQERVIREWWPAVRAEVRRADEGIDGVDVCVASSWDTAHVLATRGTAPMRRAYFIQDFEPYFYARGAEYALAEDTYRFGFRNIALGRMVADLLRAETGAVADATEFGCDTSVYRPLPDADRRGVVVYARPGVPRRGFRLAELALQRFHERRPDVPIHLYGTRIDDLPFPAVQHGRLTPVELNGLYNRCIAGVALSFTNISLVAEEMLAAGTIPVVNDSALARADLDNPNVAWALPAPDALASALVRLVEQPDREGAATRAAASVRSTGWSRAQADVVRILEEEVYGT